MEYRKLGKTGLEVSVVGMGTLGFARVALYNKGEEGIRQMVELLQRALDRGANFIDTAYAYGSGVAEEAVGRATQGRSAIILSRSHTWQTSLDPKDTRNCLEGSLQRLRRDCIDIYQIHDVTTLEAYENVLKSGVYDVLKDAKAEGKVRFIGFSTHGNLELMNRMIHSGEVDVLTLAYNILHQKRSPSDGEDPRITSEKVFPLASERGVAITIMKPFGGGVLCWKSADGTSLSPTSLLRYVVQNPYIATVTPGVESISQLEEALEAGQPSSALSEEEIRSLEEEARRWGRDICRQCGYCLPCSQKIEIPAVMRLLMMWHNQQDPSLVEQYRALRVKASQCTECGECEERCPYDLTISEKMKNAVEIFEK